MEKQSSISSSKFIGSTLNNVILNSKINLLKMKEVLDILDKASKAIIIPVLKIQKKLSLEYDIFANNYKETKEKTNTVKETVPESNIKNDFIDITKFQFNEKFVNAQENMISFYEQIAKNIDLFTKLINSDEYQKLIKGFDDIIPDSQMFVEEEKEKDKDKEKDKEKEKEKDKEKPKEKEKAKAKGKEEDKEKMDVEKPSKENNNKVKKPRKVNQKKSTKKNGKKMSSKAKDKKNGKMPKRRRKDRDLLELLHNEYPSIPYVQKVSKTFLSRRLNKKVIYRHNFKYTENGEIIEDRTRSAGESTVYKYCKSIFKFSNDDIKNVEKANEMVGKELKQQFAKNDVENKEYIIGGKISCTLNELLDRIFKQNLLKELNATEATLEFYEFYEELVNEFDETDSNVKIIFCEEKVLKNLREDWKNLELVRNFIKQKKSMNSDK